MNQHDLLVDDTNQLVVIFTHLEVFWKTWVFTKTQSKWKLCWSGFGISSVRGSLFVEECGKQKHALLSQLHLMDLPPVAGCTAVFLSQCLPWAELPLRACGAEYVILGFITSEPSCRCSVTLTQRSYCLFSARLYRRVPTHSQWYSKCHGN